MPSVSVVGKYFALRSHFCGRFLAYIRNFVYLCTLFPQAGKNYGTPYKNGIYIHSTNQSGYAGITAWSSEGSPYNAISTGCLLLAPRDFRTMNKTMSGLKSFIVRVVR